MFYSRVTLSTRNGTNKAGLPPVDAYSYFNFNFKVVGSKYKAITQDLKILLIFFMNEFIKISYALSVQGRYTMASHLDERNVRISNG